ncbi:MAG: hypothetical protein FAF05_05415 [Epsilonproteobacteria bacterium]|nr:hypothetical protein [Campylobacterota bacterium]
MKEKRGRRKRKSLFSLSTLLASFFGAAMIAGAFAYFNYKFSEYKFVNFKEWVFYEKQDIFKPSQERYIVLFYSSKKNSLQELAQVEFKYPLIAIDYYNQKLPKQKHIHPLYTATNTSLKFIQRFNLYDTPSVFLIKKHKDSLYKQDSMIHKLKNITELKKRIDSL